MTTLKNLVAPLAATAIAAGAFTAGWVTRGDAPEPPPTTGGGSGAFALASGLRPASSCEDLLASYVERGQDRVGPYGWGSGHEATFDLAEGGEALSVAPSTAPQPGVERSTSNPQGTNVQEAGVDEPDVVKTAGDLLVRLGHGTLQTWDVSGEPELLGSVAVEGHSPRSDADLPSEFLLVGDRAVVFGNRTESGPRVEEQAVVTTVDLADPAAPEVLETLDVQGTVDTARLHGDVVRLVLSRSLPDLDFVAPSWWRTESGAENRNRAIVADTDITDWVPVVDGTPVLGCEDIAVPEGDAELGATVVVALTPGEDDLGDLAALPGAGVATTSASTYVSTDRIYLATGVPSAGGRIGCWEGCWEVWNGRTRIDAFELDGTATRWVASGEVDGQVRDRWSMDAVDDSLRVAVGPSTATGDFNSVLTLRESDGELRAAGRVDHLGPGEEIKSVRWFDELAIVVTFRQTDPLYAVDLSDPDSPALLGELKIPGYSEYLHPLGSQRLLGVGQDADAQTGQTIGAQAALFDVSDLTRVRQLDVVAYPKGSLAGAGTDPRQFTWLPERRTALSVVTRGWEGRTAWISVLELDGGRMHNRMVEVEHGSDVDQVRTVPLASGEVAVVTADDVSLLDL